MRASVLSSTDGRYSSVCGQDYDWRSVAFEGPIQEGEALKIEHMRLVNEEDTRDDIGFAFLAPLRDLDVDLVPDLLFNLASFS